MKDRIAPASHQQAGLDYRHADGGSDPPSFCLAFPCRCLVVHFEGYTDPTDTRINADARGDNKL